MITSPSQPIVRIAAGSLRDYARLAPHHYRPGPPALPVRVLAARAGRSLAGVLVISMPVLNGPWRQLAWPGRYTPAAPSSCERAASAARLNAEVRTISRVIVDPAFRGTGIASALVRAYLADPATINTEAIAAMSAVCPVFAAAGMRQVPYPLSRRLRRLRRALRDLDLPSWRLAAGAAILDELDSHRRDRLVHALRVFARENRDTRALADAPAPRLVRAVASRAACRPRAWVWSCPPVPSNQPGGDPCTTK